MATKLCVVGSKLVELCVGDRFLVGGEQFVILRSLEEDGDDPAFASFKLTQDTRDSPRSLVARFQRMFGEAGAEANSAAAERAFEEQRHLLDRMAGLPTVPHEVTDSIKYPPDDQELGKSVLLLEFMHGDLLSAWMQKYESEEAKREGRVPDAFLGIRDVGKWFSMARQLVAALIPIHNVRLVHGDLRPRNIIVTTAGGSMEVKEVKLLNTQDDSPRAYPADGTTETGTFRRRYDSPLRLFEKKHPAGEFRLSESSSQWFAPTDIFSLGIILFELACGTGAKLGPFLVEDAAKISAEWPSTRGPHGPVWYRVSGYEVRRSNRQLKNALLQAWSTRLTAADLTDTLKAREDIIRMSEVILACLRSHTDAHVADLRAIEAIIDEFDPVKWSERKSEIAQQADEPASADQQKVVDCLKESLKGESHDLSLPLRYLVMRRGSRLVTQMHDLTAPKGLRFLRVNGRPAIVDTMVTLLNLLEAGDTCKALLTADFFSKKNLGPYGRVTSALQLAALIGADVQWVILVRNENLQDKQVGEILQLHRAAAERVERLTVDRKSCRKRYGVYYAIVGSETYADVLRKQLTSIVLYTERSGKADELLVAPDYHGEGGEIAALRLWPEQDKPRRTELLEALGKHEKKRLHVTTFHR